MFSLAMKVLAEGLKRAAPGMHDRGRLDAGRDRNIAIAETGRRMEIIDNSFLYEGVDAGPDPTQACWSARVRELNGGNLNRIGSEPQER
jgi:hypothetical protein